MYGTVRDLLDIFSDGKIQNLIDEEITRAALSSSIIKWLKWLAIDDSIYSIAIYERFSIDLSALRYIK